MGLALVGHYPYPSLNIVILQPRLLPRHNEIHRLPSDTHGFVVGGEVIEMQDSFYSGRLLGSGHIIFLAQASEKQSWA